MGKKETRYGFRVVVTPRSPGDFGNVFISGQTQSERDWVRQCEAIAQGIRRHVDDLPSGGDRGVSVEWNTALVCEHCGSDWTEESDAYNGGCCSKDVDPNDSEELPNCVWHDAATPFAENH